jgi:sugar phosphate isomerase/epimerase
VNRRSFVATSAAALISARYRRVQSPTLGLELTAYDDSTLKAVAAIGYRDVAVNDLYAPALRAALTHAGLTASAVHVTTPLLYRGLGRHLGVAASLGCRYFVCGRVDPEERRTQQDWHELAALFNRAGETARKAGLRFGYRVLGDEASVLLPETDPALVWFEARTPGPRCFAVDLDETAGPNALRAAGVEHYYVQAKSIDDARKRYVALRS